MNRPTTFIAAAAIGLLAYAVYFDYKRRNDAAFRKKLRKEKKKVDKTVAQTPSTSDDPAAFAGTISEADVRAAMEKVKSEELPPSPEEKETFFMSQVGMGEQLCAQGPTYYIPAAMCFYRALRVYPSPVELIMIYQTTVPEPVFKIVMEMTQLDAKDRIEGYYDKFPPKAMNVSAKVTDLPDGSGGLVRKRVLVVNKDFKAGDVIYKEQPLVSALDSDLEGKGSHCSYCLRQITKGMAIRPDTDRLNSVYCSKDCQVKSNAQSQNLLFGIEHPIPPALRQDTASADVLDARREAQTAFLEIVRQPGQVAAMLVARLIARQISVEIAKMLPGSPTAATSVADGIDSEYPIYDHIERLRYLELPVSDGKVAPLRSIFETALPGLEQFITDERYQILTGKMAYNAFGVAFAGGRDDRPITDIRPEDLERTRTPYGTARQIGAGFYMVSSYIAHSCDPSARPSFSGGTAELHLIANRDLKAGDEVTVAFVDVAQHEGESIVDARRRRRIELARGWRFACPCERCAKEDPGHGEEVQKDESKVEEPVRRFDEGVAQAQASMID